MLELLAGVLVSLAAIAVVLEPLFGPASVIATDDHDLDVVELEESESPKIQALLTLREIEFDRETGKLSDEDYRVLKAKYSAIAVAAIRDEQQDSTGDAEALEEEAERIIQEVSKQSSSVCPSCGPRPEYDAVFCSSCGRPLRRSGATACSECGSGLPADAKYCASCGATVTAPALPG